MNKNLKLIFLPISTTQRSFVIQNITTGNYLFVVNGTTGYVGIGLTNPAYPLHIVGDVYWTGTLQGGIVPWARLSGYNLDVAWSGKLGWGNLTAYPSPCPAGYAVQAIGDTLTCIQINATQGVINGSGSPGQIAFFTGGNTISGSDNLYWDNTNGRLGIGTRNPEAKLHVVGNVSISDKIAFSDVWIGRTAANRLGIYRTLDGASGDLSVRNIYFPDTSRSFIGIGNYPFLFNVNGVDVMTIGYNGNVGIGTAFPLSKLEVSGTFNATSGGGIIYLDSDGNIKVGI